MKTLSKVISIILAILGVITVFSLFDLNNLKNEFILKIITLSISNLLPLISIAICTYCLEKNDDNYFVRVLPIYLMIPICLSLIIAIFNISNGFMVDVYNFLSCTYLEIIALSLIFVVKPNNIISTFFRYIAFGLFGLTSIFEIILHFNKTTIDLTNTVYSFGSTLEISKLYIIAIIAQAFTLLLLYITNYAFSEKIELDTEDIDYDVVKDEARRLANTQMNNIYNLSPKTVEPDRSASDKGMMNINNQLGQNSNVGTSKEQAKEVYVAGSTLDSLMPLSKGPVINGAMQEEVKEVETTPVKEVDTIPPNLDIKEQMKLKVEQNQTNINQ